MKCFYRKSLRFDFFSFFFFVFRSVSTSITTQYRLPARYSSGTWFFFIILKVIDESRSRKSNNRRVKNRQRDLTRSDDRVVNFCTTDPSAIDDVEELRPVGSNYRLRVLSGESSRRGKEVRSKTVSIDAGLSNGRPRADDDKNTSTSTTFAPERTSSIVVLHCKGGHTQTTVLFVRVRRSK